MKKGLYIILAFTGIMNLYSCKDEVEIPGNPVINIQTSPADALFGDSLPFTIKLPMQMYLYLHLKPDCFMETRWCQKQLSELKSAVRTIREKSISLS